MLNFHPLSLADRPLIEAFTNDSPISFYRFSNMYMWRRVMCYRVAEDDGILYLIDAYRGGKTRAFPPFCPPEREKEALSHLLEAVGEPLFVRPMFREQAARIASYFPGAEMAPCRNEFDYLYRTEDLATLAGRRYHAKKNHVNAFLAQNGWEYHQITNETVDFLLSALSSLHEAGLSADLDEEYDANRDLIGQFSSFALRGAVLTLNGKVCALSVGEKIRPDMGLVHIEKADKAVRGAFAAINYLFAKNAFSDVQLLNREEDMGIEGLRKAKESYLPCGYNEVWGVRMIIN